MLQTIVGHGLWLNLESTYIFVELDSRMLAIVLNLIQLMSRLAFSMRLLAAGPWLARETFTGDPWRNGTQLTSQNFMDRRRAWCLTLITIMDPMKSVLVKSYFTSPSPAKSCNSPFKSWFSPANNSNNKYLVSRTLDKISNNSQSSFSLLFSSNQFNLIQDTLNLASNRKLNQS